MPAALPAALLGALVAALLACGCAATVARPAASARHPVDASPAPRGSASSASFRFFSPSSIWNAPLSASSPLAPRSRALIAYLNTQVELQRARGQAPGININSYSVPIYTVPADQPVVRVALPASRAGSALQSAFDAVPLPADAQPAAGTDAHLVVWQPSSNRLWEFWRLAHGPEGWQASWGGAIEDVTASSGVLGPRSWRGATRSWGASASSLSIAGGLITLEDLARGRIEHALALGIPDPRAGLYASPAQRTDGKAHDPLALPEGAHLRLNPRLKLASLHLPKLTLMIAEAAQRYGIVIRDTASHTTFYAQDPIPTGADPYAGPGGYLEGRTPAELLERFPWKQLQVLRMSVHPYASHPAAGPAS